MKTSNQCLRCFYIATAFYDLPWGRLVKACASAKKMKISWKESEQKYEAVMDIDGTLFTRLLFDIPTGVKKAMESGISLESWYWFLRITEFQLKYKYQPEVLDCKVVSIKDETGQHMIRGVIVRPAIGEAFSHCYRVLRFYNKSCWNIDEIHLSPDRQLREEQPMETFLKIGKKEAKKIEQD